MPTLAPTALGRAVLGGSSGSCVALVDMRFCKFVTPAAVAEEAEEIAAALAETCVALVARSSIFMLDNVMFVAGKVMFVAGKRFATACKPMEVTGRTA